MHDPIIYSSRGTQDLIWAPAPATQEPGSAEWRDVSGFEGIGFEGIGFERFGNTDLGIEALGVQRRGPGWMEQGEAQDV